MLDFCVLSSGSRANAIYIGSEDTHVLLDCGLSAKQAALRLGSIGIAPESISAIVLSHEHEDHAAGVRVFSKRFGTMVYANQGTLDSCRHLDAIPQELLLPFDSGASFVIGALHFEPFSLVHDAVDPVGFRISAGGQTLAVATDLGQLTTLVRERVRGVDALILEANHDPQLLEEAPYPWSLKQRISSRQGHLSNETAASVLMELSESNCPRLRIAVAAHISEKSNTPELAIEVFKRAWRKGGHVRELEVLAATASEPSRLFRLRAEPEAEKEPTLETRANLA